MQEKILLVEDSPDFQVMIQKITGYKYDLDLAANISEARIRVKESAYDLLLLDIGLPDGSGFDLCRDLHNETTGYDLPTVLLSGSDSIANKLLGFSFGADDYITKPFDPQELLARIDMRITKAKRQRVMAENLVRGPIRLNIGNMSLFLRAETGSEIKVEATPIEFKLLLKLAKNLDQVMSRQQLMDAVWGRNVYIEDRSIDKHISSLRKKISPFGDWIHTVSGVGYEFGDRGLKREIVS